MQLTAKSELLLRVLYKEYLRRLDSGMIKSESFSIGDIFYIRENLVSQLSQADVEKASDELFKYNLIFKNLWGYIALKNEFLEFCENNYIKI